MPGIGLNNYPYSGQNNDLAYDIIWLMSQTRYRSGDPQIPSDLGISGPPIANFRPPTQGMTDAWPLIYNATSNDINVNLVVQMRGK